MSLTNVGLETEQTKSSLVSFPENVGVETRGKKYGENRGELEKYGTKKGEKPVGSHGLCVLEKLEPKLDLSNGEKEWSFQLQ